METERVACKKVHAHFPLKDFKSHAEEEGA
jgi:hypothetical protein